jgi:hypothetical protein
MCGVRKRRPVVAIHGGTWVRARREEMTGMCKLWCDGVKEGRGKVDAGWGCDIMESVQLRFRH